VLARNAVVQGCLCVRIKSYDGPAQAQWRSLVRPLKQIYVWIDNCCMLCCTNMNGGERLLHKRWTAHIGKLGGRAEASEVTC